MRPLTPPNYALIEKAHKAYQNNIPLQWQASESGSFFSCLSHDERAHNSIILTACIDRAYAKAQALATDVDKNTFVQWVSDLYDQSTLTHSQLYDKRAATLDQRMKDMFATSMENASEKTSKKI